MTQAAGEFTYKLESQHYWNPSNRHELGLEPGPMGNPHKQANCFSPLSHGTYQFTLNWWYIFTMIGGGIQTKFYTHAKYAKICNNMQNMQLGQAGFEPRTFGIKDNTLPTLPTVPDSLTPKYVYVIFLCTLLRIFAYHCIFCAYSLHIYCIFCAYSCIFDEYSVHIFAYSLHIYSIFSAYSFICIT